ncbi:hypothetical protein BC941DRAFT_164769 [Chlamydoabsidia padenii]|nr:hypothetical protein BC941DRAFT_164769 [Chlamydoabsidia padenii]
MFIWKIKDSGCILTDIHLLYLHFVYTHRSTLSPYFCIPMLSQDQYYTPKAVNIIRPSSPLFYYLKQRPSSALNQQQGQHHYYYQQQHLAPTKMSDSHSESGSITFSDSTSSSPSTLSTHSYGSGTDGSNSRLTTPSILNSASFGIGFFQSQQNSSAANSPTWFKSCPPPASINSTLTPTTPKPTPINGFMHPFSSRFFCGTSADDSSYFSRRQPSASDIQESSGDRQDGNDFDSIDGDTDPEDSDNYSLNDDNIYDSMVDSGNESQDDDDNYDKPIKVVARIKNGIIMNGKGEMVSKGIDDSIPSWLDESRASRKIADLEIEKSSLMALNSALESKVAQQAIRIAKLEKQLQVHEWPLSPASDKDEDQACFDKLLSPESLIEQDIANDHVFQRLQSTLLGLIEQAEQAIRLETKSTGRVLTVYNDHFSKEDTITLNAPPTTLKHSTRITPYSSHRRSLQTTKPRRDSQLVTRKQSTMERSLSRLSSPAVLVTTKDASRSTCSSMRRSSTKSRQSNLRKSQDLDSPKWHY